MLFARGVARAYAPAPSPSRPAPPSPPKARQYGDYSFKATVRVRDARSQDEVARCVGYDITPGIAEATLRACKAFVGSKNKKKTLDAPELVLLPRGLDTSGQVWYHDHGSGTSTLIQGDA